MKKDLISKEIVSGFVKEIAKDFLGLDVNEVEELNIEFKKIETKRADFLALLDKKFILHIEIQSSYEKKFSLRMLRYYTEIKYKYDYPVYQIAIYLGKGRIESRIDDFFIDYSFKLIDLKKIDCDYFLKRDNPYAIVLSILCDFKDKDAKSVIEEIINRLKEYNDFKKYFLMVEELSTLRGYKDIVKECEMAVLVDDVKLEDLPSYEIGLEKGIEKGIERGIEKGKLQIIKSLIGLIDDETLSKKTGVDINIIKKLKDEQ